MAVLTGLTALTGLITFGKVTLDTSVLRRL